MAFGNIARHDASLVAAVWLDEADWEILTVSQIPLEPLHRFHPYCARFPSEIVEAAPEKYTKPGDGVFDPFCGSGTTLVASLAHRRQAVGIDIDMLAGSSRR